MPKREDGTTYHVMPEDWSELVTRFSAENDELPNCCGINLVMGFPQGVDWTVFYSSYCKIVDKEHIEKIRKQVHDAYDKWLTEMENCKDDQKGAFSMIAMNEHQAKEFGPLLEKHNYRCIVNGLESLKTFNLIFLFIRIHTTKKMTGAERRKADNLFDWLK